MALIHCDFFSNVLGMATSLCAILPDPVPAQAGRARSTREAKHPTLYLLHGLSDDHTIWQRRTSIERYVQAYDLAVIMPSVHRSFYADMARGLRYWTFVSEEVPALARAYFPLSAARKDNFVAGLSMGGYGAFKLALTHPDRYVAAASLSGAMDVVRYVKEADKASRPEIRNMFGGPRAVAGGPNDLFRLATQLARRKGVRPRLYQWCGTEDFLYQDNVRFHAHADALALDLTYEEGPGVHDWACWDQQIQRVLAWLSLRARAVS